MVAAAYDWSGFYIGVNGGGAWSRKCWDINPFTINLPIVAAPINVGWPGRLPHRKRCDAGGQIGYRWQSAAWVFGVEAQGNWADLSSSNLSQNAFFAGTGIANRSRIDAIGLFTGQVGYSWNTFAALREGRRCRRT